MALSRQMQHQIRIGLPDGFGGGRAIAQIHFQQLMAALRHGAELLQHLLDAGEIAGVAHLVEVEHQRLALPQQSPHHGATDVHEVGRRP
jgi:hypothetical protein